MTFAEWVLTDAEKCVRVDLTAHDGTSQVNKYIASRYYFDSVNDVEYLDRLIDPLIIRRSLGGAFGRPEATVGAISIDNADRELDDWIDYAWHGWSVVIRLGDPSWSSDDARWSVRFRGLANKMEAEDNILTLFTRDKSEKLDRPIVERPLNMHPQSLLEPYPVTFGRVRNITPPRIRAVGGSHNGAFTTAAWGEDGGLVHNEVYENGLATGKSIVPVEGSGSGNSGFAFFNAAPEGTVTADIFGVTEDPEGTGDTPENPGEILQLALTYKLNRESGIAQGGSTTTIVLDDNASSVDDYYNGSGATHNDVGWVSVFKRDGSTQETNAISDYDGSTKTATLASALSFSVASGDRYDITPPEYVQHGPYTDSDLDTASFNQLDINAPYIMGIYDVNGSMTYLELLDTILPAGAFHYFKSDGTISVGLLSDPSDDLSVFTIDQYETRGKIRLIQDDVPIYRARVGYNRNWTVMNSPDAGVSIDRASFLNNEYRWESEEDLSIKDEYPDAPSVKFPSFISEYFDGADGGQEDAQTEAKRILGLFGVARQRIMVEGLSGLFSVDLHDVVTLKDDTYGLDAGKDYRVVMMEERPMQGTVDVELWG